MDQRIVRKMARGAPCQSTQARTHDARRSKVPVQAL